MVANGRLDTDVMLSRKQPHQPHTWLPADRCVLMSTSGESYTCIRTTTPPVEPAAANMVRQHSMINWRYAMMFGVTLKRLQDSSRSAIMLGDGNNLHLIVVFK